MTALNEKQKTKLSRVPRGYWRNRWFILRTIVSDEGVRSPNEEYIAPYRWPSREVAEEKARVTLDADAVFQAQGKPPAVKYLGPVFFPEPHHTGEGD